MDGIERFSVLCANGWVFGDTLADMLQKYKKLKSDLARTLVYSNGWISDVIKGELPSSLNLKVVNQMAKFMQCDREDTEILVIAFLCSVLQKRGLFS